MRDSGSGNALDLSGRLTQHTTAALSVQQRWIDGAASQMEPSIAITGRGVVSAAGCAVDAVAERLRQGWMPQESRRFRAGREYCDVPPYYSILDEPAAGPKGLRTADPFTINSALAAAQALQEARVEDMSDVGLVFNTVVGPVQAGQDFLERVLLRGPVGVSPSLFLDSLVSMPAAHLSMLFGFRGSTAVLSGTHPFELARQWLWSGRERTIVLGATERFSPRAIDAFGAYQVETPGGEVWPKLGQASGAMVVETTSRAVERGVVPTATVEAVASEAMGAIEPTPWVLQADVAETAIRRALEQASASAEQVTLVCSCANGVPVLDQPEAEALRRVFSEQAPIIHPKRTFGETAGSSGVLGVLSATLALANWEAGSSEGLRGAPLALVNDFDVGGQFWCIVLRVGKGRA